MLIMLLVYYIEILSKVYLLYFFHAASVHLQDFCEGGCSSVC